MDKNKDIQDKIDNFLKENRINITGGTISNEEELSEVLNNVAMSDLQKGKVDKALYFANKAMEFNSKNYYTLFIKGLIYRYTQKYNEAIEVFKEYNTYTNDKLSYIYIGFCYAELNDGESALDYFRKCEKEFSEEDKNQYSALMSTVYECMGNIYINKENILEFYEDDKFKLSYKLAIKYFKLSLRINKENDVLLNKLAVCYYHFEDINKALYCFEEAVKISPENAAYLEAIEEMKEMGAISEMVEF